MKISTIIRKFPYLAVVLFLLVSCATPRTSEYKQFYSHLNLPLKSVKTTWTSDYYLIVYVDARHLDYTDNASFFRTVAKHPSDCSKTGDVGHAWIYLQGIVDDEVVYLEGGHSGERGIYQAKYFDGIMNYIDFGFANPTVKQIKNPRYEPNPVKYLYAVQYDGYFEWGPGRHKPTFAAKIDISKKQFDEILDYINSYNFQHYSLIGNQCASFAANVAKIAGIDLDCKTTITIDSVMSFRNEKIRFWADPFYAKFTISTPDALERSLIHAVLQGKMELIIH